MADRVDLALQALRDLRSGSGYRQLPRAQQAELDQQLRDLEQALNQRSSPARGQVFGGRAASARAVSSRDRYAELLGTPADLQRQLDGGGSSSSIPAATSAGATSVGAASPVAAAPPPPVAAPPGTAQIGGRAAAALEAVNFPAFVASLVTGTFQAVVDASKHQIEEYANLVARLSTSLDDFSRDNVTPNQVRDWIAGRYPEDVAIAFPAPGKSDPPRLVPRPGREGSSPAWLDQFDLGGSELSEELTDGPLLDAGRLKVGEERMQTLATLVLMGINRIVVGDGDITARLQFHASARETNKADLDSQQLGIASQSAGGTSGVSMLVSTIKANAQADASIKADLLGQVRIAFRSETFPLERFADSAAIQLINRHAGGKRQAPATTPAAAPAARGAPLPATPLSAAQLPAAPLPEPEPLAGGAK
jgi:hypothetical protein